MSDKTKREPGKEYHDCSDRVHHSGMIRSFGCSRSGTKEHEGEWYCWQHYPPTVKAREAKVRARQAEKYDKLAVDMRRRHEAMVTMDGMSIVQGQLSEGAAKALWDAANWVLHVVSGVGKSGGPPEDGECEDALDSLKIALERFKETG